MKCINKKDYNSWMREHGKYGMLPNFLWYKDYKLSNNVADNRNAKMVFTYLMCQDLGSSKSQEIISEELGLAQKTLRNALKLLCSHNILKIYKTPGMQNEYEGIYPGDWKIDQNILENGFNENNDLDYNEIENNPVPNDRGTPCLMTVGPGVAHGPSIYKKVNNDKEGSCSEKEPDNESTKSTENITESLGDDAERKSLKEILLGFQMSYRSAALERREKIIGGLIYAVKEAGYTFQDLEEQGFKDDVLKATEPSNLQTRMKVRQIVSGHYERALATIYGSPIEEKEVLTDNELAEMEGHQLDLERARKAVAKTNFTVPADDPIRTRWKW